jgi:hypothetical protein
MGIRRDTWSLYGRHLCQFVFKSFTAWQNNNPDKNVYLQIPQVRLSAFKFSTLTLDVGTWDLDATRRLDVEDIFAKLFKNT